jgi:hypothetical protein
MDGRFAAMDQQTVKVANEHYRFVRIRNARIIEGKSTKFRRILIVPCADASLSMIILQLAQPKTKVRGATAAKVNLTTMHADVRDALANLKVTTTHENQKLWLPQFKIGNKKEQDQMRSEEPIKNFKAAVDPETKEATYVQEYVNQSVFELFAPPESDSHMILEMNRAKELVVDDSEFIVAMNLEKLEQAEIELPLCVAQVTKANWRKAGLN